MFLTTPRLEVFRDPDHPGRYLRYFRLLDPWEYVWVGPDDKVRRWKFEAGWTTDLSSVPITLHWLLDPFELGVAAFPHDAGYQAAGHMPFEFFDVAGEPCDEPWTRKDLDRFYCRVLSDVKTPKYKRRLAYWGLRVGAKATWERYEEARSELALPHHRPTSLLD